MATGANVSAEDEIEHVRDRLRALEAEQLALRDRLEELERHRAVSEAANPALNPSATAAVTMASSSSAKVALFRRLFAGREDVFPIRWENRKAGKGGYAPACANEWVKGVCNKPRVKCGDCPNQHRSFRSLCHPSDFEFARKGTYGQQNGPFPSG